MKTIYSPQAPKPIGPYSQAVIHQNLIFFSGQIGLDQDGNLSPDIVSQTTKIMDNLLSILKQANLDFTSVVKTTIYLTNLDNFSKVNEIYGKFFPINPPARSTLGVSSLPKGALVEIDMIAVTELLTNNDN